MHWRRRVEGRELSVDLLFRQSRKDSLGVGGFEESSTFAHLNLSYNGQAIRRGFLSK